MKQLRASRQKPKKTTKTKAKKTNTVLKAHDAKLELAMSLMVKGQLEDAKVIYKAILQSKPQDFNALQLLGVIATQQNNLTDAVDFFNKALKINANHVGTLNNRGIALAELGHTEQAIESYMQALIIQPDFVDALNNKGISLRKMGCVEQALNCFEEVLTIQPSFVDALNNRGLALYGLNYYERALASYEDALLIKPDFVEALNNKGMVLYKLDRFELALESINKALFFNPNFVEALNFRGNTLLKMNLSDQALDSYNEALAIEPERIVVLNNRGNALLELCRFEQALDSFDQALDLNPGFEEALNNRGNALLKLRRFGQALASYNAALEINSGSAEILNNHGNALRSMRRFKDAADSYAKVLVIEPDYYCLYGLWLHTKMMICDWRDIDNQFLELTEKIERGEKAASPFQLIPITSSGALQRKAADIYMQAECPVSHVLGDIVKHPKHNKIHIGYFSADFFNHATAHLIAELLELHDKSCFELTAFSFGPKSKDEMRQRMEIMFDRFVEVSDLSDKEVAQQARNLGIDIAVDLKGYTFDSRPGIFALRAAPIQVSYLGYPGTMGAEYIDYLIADTTLIPETHQKYYTEKIAYLPNSYQVNDTKREIADKTYTRTELGLPATGFVFCCFNNNYKIIPQIFDSWMCILKQVEGSVLWLFEGTEDAASNLRKEAESRGVNSDRLVFAPRLPLPEHLARHCMADLFLDTLPCNAHTTASDALWAGLPVLTCLGETFASRVAASLLNAMHLPELITSTLEDYETLAIEFALNPEKLNSIKKKLFDNRLTAPLFNTPLFTCHLEAAYTEMYTRYQEDFAPEHFYVSENSLLSGNAASIVASRQADIKKETSNSKLEFAIAMHQDGQLDKAETIYKEILGAQPEQQLNVLQLLAVIAVQNKNSKVAIELFDRILEVSPNQAGILNNRGLALASLNNYSLALDSYDKALSIRPDLVDAYNNRGLALASLNNYSLALDSYDKALAIKPDFVEVYNNRAVTLFKLKRIKEAMESYSNSLAIKPGYAFLYGLWLHTKMMICDWSDIENQFLELAEKIEGGEKVASPFQLIAITSSAALQRKAAELYMQALLPVSNRLGDIAKYPKHNTIRIGYFSADFYNHATAHLIAELLELHDKSRFELIAFSFGPESRDIMRQRMEVMFDRFIDVSNLSDKEVAQQARSLGIDIAVDLKGYTMDSRPGIFALRAAPVQVSYLGYPGTMGAEYIDYLIADSTLIPEAHQKYYTEKIAYLPNSYQVNDTKREIADKTFTREELGLPATGFVFCCFNNNYKIVPQIFDSWMRILKQVDGSVLWLFEGTEDVACNLRKEAERRDVSPSRLVFASRLALPEHLARHSMADLFLDTLPCNAHTTASDALWAGLPVLTCLGEAFASRVAASLLNAVQLPELITTTLEGYEKLAIELALNPEKLKGIKTRLIDNRLTTPLFNTPLFTHHIEAAYSEMYSRYQADLVPEHFYVKDSVDESERILFTECPLCKYSTLTDLMSADCSKHPLCRSSLSHIIKWKQCGKCAHVFTEGYYTEDICKIIYSKSNENPQVGIDLENQRKLSAHVIEKVLPYANSGDWLDVEFGSGSLLFTAQEYGFRPIGLEARIENVQKLRRLGIESYSEYLEKQSFNNKCSVISMVNVLEKVTFPQDILRAAHRLLSDTGVIFVSLPNSENIVWKTLEQSNANPYWSKIENYHNFSRTRLYQLLEEVGFEPVRYGISECYPVCMDVIAKKKDR